MRRSLKKRQKSRVAEFRRGHGLSLHRLPNRQHTPHHFESHPVQRDGLSLMALQTHFRVAAKITCIAMSGTSGRTCDVLVYSQA
jgi:hypothetical protein